MNGPGPTGLQGTEGQGTEAQGSKDHAPQAAASSQPAESEEARGHLRPVGKGKRRRRTRRGLSIRRHFTHPGEDPFDAVAWERRSAKIGNEKGETVF